MLTLRMVIENADSLKPNKIDWGVKVEWLNALDGKTWQEVFLTHADCPDRDAPEYYADDDVDTEMLIQGPYAYDIYNHYLEMCIDREHEELQKYNANLQFFQDAYNSWAAWYTRQHRPLNIGTWRF